MGHIAARRSLLKPEKRTIPLEVEPRSYATRVAARKQESAKGGKCLGEKIRLNLVSHYGERFPLRPGGA